MRFILLTGVSVAVRAKAILQTMLLAMLLCSGSEVWSADDVITIEGTRIRGNQELPTILYLIPWQAPEVQQLDEPKQSVSIQRSLEPLERSEFIRLLGYHRQFKQSGNLKSGTMRDEN